MKLDVKTKTTSFELYKVNNFEFDRKGTLIVYFYSEDHKAFTNVKQVITLEEPEKQKYLIYYFDNLSICPIEKHTTDEENLISDVKYALSCWNKIIIEKCR